MTPYGFALAFIFVVFWAEEVATVLLWLAALASILGGALWAYYNPNAVLAALGIFVVFTWPIILSWAIYLPLCCWHGVKPRAPWKPWVPLKQHEPWRRKRQTSSLRNETAEVGGAVGVGNADTIGEVHDTGAVGVWLRHNRASAASDDAYTRM